MTAPRRGSRAWVTLCQAWQAKIDQHGGWTCRRCGGRIPPHNRAAWQLGHPNDITTGTTRITDLEPEHAHENMSAGAAAGNRARALKNLPPSRTWT